MKSARLKRRTERNTNVVGEKWNSSRLLRVQSPGYQNISDANTCSVGLGRARTTILIADSWLRFRLPQTRGARRETGAKIFSDSRGDREAMEGDDWNLIYGDTRRSGFARPVREDTPSSPNSNPEGNMY